MKEYRGSVSLVKVSLRQGARSKEQRAGSSEQGAGSREQDLSREQDRAMANVSEVPWDVQVVLCSL